MFHVNIEIMNNDRYVFIASNHQYENKCYTVRMMILLPQFHSFINV